MKAWLCALLSFVAVTAQALPVETLKTSGPAANRIDVTILGDGYTAAEQGKLTSDATALMNALFSASPWKEYRGLFNVKLVKVVSNQSGADNGSLGATRDTALGAYFNCFGIDRLLCVDTGAVATLAVQNTPDYDLAIVVVNDSKYGGSGGGTPVASTNGSSAEILIHELGHSIAQLADEYESPYPGYPGCDPTTDCSEPNATVRNNASVKWKAWIPSGTPLPTPEGQGYSDIGIFEGCRYQSTGVFRPKDTGCRMNQLGVPFCKVCGEGLVLSFWSRVSPVDSQQPAASVPGPGCAQVTFGVSQPSVAPPTWSYAWTVNGSLRPETTAQLTLGTAALSAGASVQLTVKDATALVRNDPWNLLQETASWTVAPSACDGGVTPVDAGFDAGFDAGAKDAGTPTQDAGTPEDAGHQPWDAGAVSDGGQQPVVLLDAGVGLAPPVEGGCGCTTLNGTALFGMAAGLSLLARRRRATFSGPH